MAKLFLLRHLQSQWNLENRFTGWTDVALSKKGVKNVKKLASKISKLKIDVVYTSPLARNQETVSRVLMETNKKYPIFLHFKGKMKEWGNFKDLKGNYMPVYVSEKLNERYYGKLQGLNKADIIKKYGSDKIHSWRRGFNQGPPSGEKLKDTFKRTTPFFKKYIEKDLKKGRNVLIVASHNSLRALAKYVENISDKEIINLEIPVGTLTEYSLNKSLSIKSKKTL